MFAQSPLRLIFLSILTSSVLLPMERSVKTTSKKYKENTQEQEAIEESKKKLADSRQKLDERREALRQRKTLLENQSKNPSVQEKNKKNTQEQKAQNEFAQEEAFHTKLIQQDLIQEGALSYYKKITPILSNPNDLRADRWLIITVSIRGQIIRPNANGIYTHDGISFTINPETFEPTQPNLMATHNNILYEVPLNASSEKKVPVPPGFDSYDALLSAIKNHKFSLRRYVTLEGIVEIPDENPCVISIKCKKQRTEPIKLRGMEIVCGKNKNITTKIFLDFTDQDNESIELCNPIECAHAEVTVDKTVICIRDHKAYECTGKKICGFFDSPETRKKWIPDESNFYDQDQHIKTSLPSCYSTPDDHQAIPKEHVVWVFGNDHDSFYQRDSIENLQDTNKYIYSNGNSFFLTLPYKSTYKKYLSNNHNTIELDYLVKITEPQILIHTNTSIDGGRRKWLTGVYEKIPEGNGCSWQRIETSVKDSIDFDNEPQLDFVFPTHPLNTQQNKNWCDAAQRFAIDFPVNIRCYNQEMANGLQRWNKITQLNLPRLFLENGLTWNNVFNAVGTMTQLKSLCFENNHPVADLMANKAYCKMANHASDYYRDLNTCLINLINLEELHIQGLWLKPRGDLGSGCTKTNSGVVYSQNDNYDVSTQVATLTGIINHEQQVRVRAIINSICALRHLKNLSIDGIPNHGSSDYARKTNGEKFFLAPLWIVTSYFQNQDGWSQDAALKQLVIDSANQIARRASLQTISVYSPGGNCNDYFSRAFRDRLAVARRLDPALQPLNIIPKDLQ